MSYDRELWLEVWNNVAKYEAEGIPVNKRYMSPLPQIGESYDGWRLEPSNEKEFGPNAKYFKHDIAEAKKLMAAAGHANGLELKLNQVKGTDYGINFAKEVEMRSGMNADIGIKYNVNLMDYQTEFIPQIRDTQGQWEGAGFRSGPPATSGTPVGQYSFFYSSKAGISFIGHPDGSDSFVDDNIKKAQVEFDTEKRRTIVHDLEKYLAEQMYCIMGVAGGSGFSLVWPAVANYRVWRGGTANAYRTENSYLWVDQTKAPLK
jgi:ABC-type transport system substrate-binding protein